MRIKDFGTKKDIYESIPGKLDIESNAMSEIIYLTKVLGNYNITKIDNKFIFENEGYAAVMEKL